MEINLDDFNWTEKPVIGTALLVMGGSTDSLSNPILPDVHYEVGKHKKTGQVVLMPTDKER